MVEVFAAALGGDEGGSPRTGQFFLAADPVAFSAGAFAERITALCAAIADQPGA